MNPISALSASQIASAPVSTGVGVYFLSQLAQNIATQGLPGNLAGWIVFGLHSAAGLLGLFGGSV